MHYTNQMTIHGIRPIGHQFFPSVGAIKTQTPVTQYASFQFDPVEYYSQFPEQYYYDQWFGQPQFANIYANPLTSVSPVSVNPYVVQPPIASIRFGKSGE